MVYTCSRTIKLFLCTEYKFAVVKRSFSDTHLDGSWCAIPVSHKPLNRNQQLSTTGWVWDLNGSKVFGKSFCDEIIIVGNNSGFAACDSLVKKNVRRYDFILWFQKYCKPLLIFTIRLELDFFFRKHINQPRKRVFRVYEEKKKSSCVHIVRT